MKNTSFMAAVSVWALVAFNGSAQCQPERVISPALWDTAAFGRSVDVLGEVAVIGDSSDHSFCPIFTCNSGAVHVFRRIGEDWDREATLYHSLVSERDGFGAAVSFDGSDRFAASAPGEDAAGGDTGAIYMFEHNGEAWREVHEVLPVEPVWSRCFGCTLALQGDTLVASQRNDACWVYRERSGRWEFDQKIPAPPSVSFTWYGDGLSLDGDWLAVGAPHDSTYATRGGLVHLYRRDAGGRFELVQTLVPPEREKTASFGAAVAIAGDLLLVGAPFLDSRVGVAFIYELEHASWTLKAKISGSPVRSEFGASVALHGDTIIVGAPLELISEEEGLGATYVFRRQADSSWRLSARLLPPPPSVYFGDSVATDGASIIVGAPKEPVDSRRNPGAAHIFEVACLLCRADLDGDGELTFFDFLAFQNLFAAGDLRADFDGDGALTFFDFLAFQNEFAAGCD